MKYKKKDSPVELAKQSTKTIKQSTKTIKQVLKKLKIYFEFLKISLKLHYRSRGITVNIFPITANFPPFFPHYRVVMVKLLKFVPVTAVFTAVGITVSLSILYAIDKLESIGISVSNLYVFHCKTKIIN